MVTDCHLLNRPTTDADGYLPEGPRAMVLGGRDALVWINIQTGPDAKRGALHVAFWNTTERRRYPLPARPGFVFPTDAPDTVFLGLEQAVGTLNLKTGMWTPFATIPDPHPRTIINDGEIVPGGRAIVFGSKDTAFQEPVAKLYLFTLSDNRLSVLADGQTCSNGKVFADDGRTLFDIDTPTRCVREYQLDIAARKVSQPRVKIDLAGESGFPDGICDGGEGSVIVAFYNPDAVADGKAVRYRLSDGATLESWRVPGSPRVTCPLLVPREGVTLILTTATEGMPPETRAIAPNAGGLFSAKTTVKTCPPAEWVRL